jgi:hypothetical protein
MTKTPTSQLKFIMDAWGQVVECRRMLKWTYAYGYYAFEEEGDPQVEQHRTFFEFLQGDAERSLEKVRAGVSRGCWQAHGECGGESHKVATSRWMEHCGEWITALRRVHGCYTPVPQRLRLSISLFPPQDTLLVVVLHPARFVLFLAPFCNLVTPAHPTRLHPSTPSPPPPPHTHTAPRAGGEGAARAAGGARGAGPHPSGGLPGLPQAPHGADGCDQAVL